MRGIKRALLLSSASLVLFASAASLRAQCPNPIDGTDFFIKQQYQDFLGRQPTASELSTARNQINVCGTNASCISRQRQLFSRSFWDNSSFRSQSRTFGLSSFSPPLQYDNYDFVALCYYVYLQRAPNAAPDYNYDGFNFWLGSLNDCTGPEDYGDRDTYECYNNIIQAFLVSTEYRARFGC